MRMKYAICLIAFLALCGCSEMASDAADTLPSAIPGNYSPNLVAGSSATLVVVDHERDASSLKSQLKDTYVLSIYDVRTGSRTVAQSLSANGLPFQARQCWTDGSGALLYGFTQDAPGMKNRKYHLLRIGPGGENRTIPINHALGPAFFDETTRLLGWRKPVASPSTVSFMNLGDGKTPPERVLDRNFFYAHADGKGAAYLFSAIGESIVVAKYTLPSWNRQWETPLVMQWAAESRANVLAGILCVTGDNHETGARIDTGSPVHCNDMQRTAITFLGNAYAVEKTKGGLILRQLP